MIGRRHNYFFVIPAKPQSGASRDSTWHSEAPDPGSALCAVRDDNYFGIDGSVR